MCLIRHFEERVVKLFHQGLIRGATHVYLGEEAVAAGACAALRPGDTITSTHRGHGHCIARGLDVKPMLAELLGKATGYCGGKGGSMHIADLKRGILGANGIVGGGIPLAAGAGLTAAYKQTGQVPLCFFSDGAAQQGGIHESLNLAAVWKLPVVYICENNCFALTTPNRDECCIENIGDRAAAYGIPGCVIDGNDACCVRARPKAGRGETRRLPVAIDCKTYGAGHYLRSGGLPHEGGRYGSGSPRSSPLVPTRQARSFPPLRRIDRDARLPGRGREFARQSPPPAPENAHSGLWGPEKPFPAAFVSGSMPR